MRRERVVIPAKAMLFGEYGVLAGSPAVAVTIPDHRFVLEVALAEAKPPGVTVFSSHFPGGQITFGWEESTGSSERDIRFFGGIVAPFFADFSESHLSITVEESFSPSLGFGSSSALLGGVHLALERLAGREPQPNLGFWDKVRASLQAIQGRGSGYDVGVQVHAALQGTLGIAVWSFTPAAVPVVEQIAVKGLERFGCFLSTGIYADTGKLIKGDTSHWAAAHGRIASEFLAEPGAERLPAWMARSRRIAQEQGLLGSPAGELSRLAQMLSPLPWKTMGAGHGDCLWVGAPLAELASLGHPRTGRPLSESVVFAFESKES